MRILVVEDEPRIAHSLKKGLELEHYAVDLADNGEDSLSLGLSEEYDLIVLDLMLPQRDGISVCRELRQHKIHTPVLMLTAKAQVADTVNGLDAGADDYLTKPFSFEELLARVRALTRRPAQVLPTVLRSGDLELDPSAFMVTRAGAKVSLSHKEFALLAYFLRHPNQVLTKEHLIAHVWDYDANILPNTVEVYLRNLRAKLERPFPHLPRILETVRGFGYRLSPGT